MRARLFAACMIVFVLSSLAYVLLKQDSDSPLTFVECTNENVVYLKNRDYVIAINKDVSKNALGKDTIFVDFIRTRETSAEFTRVMRNVEKILLERKLFGSEKSWDIQSWASYGSNQDSVRYAVTAIEKK